MDTKCLYLEQIFKVKSPRTPKLLHILTGSNRNTLALREDTLSSFFIKI